MDEKKRIIEFDAAESVPVDGQLPIDSASQGTKKITPALLLKAITDLLGDEALDTLAQTLTGAVNEVKGIADDAQDLAENISDEYSSSSAYAKGDYCIHNNTLYKCTTAIGSGGEAWNASHWSATKCDDELSELKGTLTHEAVTLTNTDSRLYYNQIYKENNKVTLYIEVYVTTTPPTSNPIVLGVLPSGSRPTHRHIAFNNVTNANSTALLGGCQFIVNTNGEITLFYFGNYTQSFATLEVSFYVN